MVSPFLPPPSLPPRAVQAGLGRTGGSRSQHSRGGLGGQALGKGPRESVNPSMSREILSVTAESCKHTPPFETHTQVTHTHTGHTRSKHAHTHMLCHPDTR